MTNRNPFGRVLFGTAIFGDLLFVLWGTYDVCARALAGHSPFGVLSYWYPLLVPPALAAGLLWAACRDKSAGLSPSGA